MNFEVNAHDAPLSRLVFLRADGSTGTLDLHDDNALHDEDEVIKAKHLAAHAVTNGKIAPGAVTDNELAGHAVDRRHLSEELDTELANLKKSCDSISQEFLVTKEMTLPSVTAQAYSHVNASISNITISGYKAIGVVGFNLANYFCSLVTCKLQGTGVGMTIYNSNSSSASMTPTVTILYAKTF